MADIPIRHCFATAPKGFTSPGRCGLTQRYALAQPDPNPGRGRPRKKGERLPTPQSMFNDLKLDWDWIDIFLYGKETVVVVYRFEAIWYKASGNEPLSIVLVWDPTGAYPGQRVFRYGHHSPIYSHYPVLLSQMERRDHLS